MDKYNVNARSAIMMSRSSNSVENRVATALQLMMEMAKPYWTMVQRDVQNYETKIHDSINLLHGMFKLSHEAVFRKEGLIFDSRMEERELGYRFTLSVKDQETDHENTRSFYILDYPISSKPVELSMKETIRWQLRAYYDGGKATGLVLYRVEDRNWIMIEGFSEATPEYTAKYRELLKAFNEKRLTLNTLSTNKNLTTIEIMDWFLNDVK